MTHPESLIRHLEAPLGLSLRFADVPIALQTNDEEVLNRLQRYYEPYLVENAGSNTVVTLIQGEVRPGGEFADVCRGPGRKVKEAVRDVAGGRLILKRTTGVVMGLSPGRAWAAGDLRAHLNQGINLINACYAKAVLERGHLLLHASAVSWGGKAAALAGPPGAGKSTAALALVEAGFRFLSNDRILVRPTRDGVEALGYPKQPRVNPGTLFHHPRLASLLDPDDRGALAAMPAAELWALERKADVDLDAIYGKGTVDIEGRLEALALLKWRRDGQGFTVRRLESAEALANVPLFHKDLGVFDLDWPAHHQRATERLEAYANLLGRLRVIEVTGGIDFEAFVEVVGDLRADPAEG